MRLPKKLLGIDIEQTKKMVDIFMDAGLKYFDTAYVYEGGLSEAAAKEALEDVRRQLAASNKDVTEFILHSKAVQQSFSAMFDSLDKISERDMQTAQKLNAGTLALLKRFADRCSGLEGRGSSAEPLPNQINMGG